MGDLTVATHELVRVEWPTVWVLAAAVHLWLGLVWVLWFHLKRVLMDFLGYSSASFVLTSHCVIESKPWKAW